MKSSSLSAPTLARQCGIKYPTLAAWIAVRKRGESEPTPKNQPAYLIAGVAARSDGDVDQFALSGAWKKVSMHYKIASIIAGEEFHN